VSLSPSPPFSVSQQAGWGLIKIFPLSVQNTTNIFSPLFVVFDPEWKKYK
jgi:hypothetical protein